MLIIVFRSNLYLDFTSVIMMMKIWISINICSLQIVFSTISSKFNDFTARGSCAVTGLVRFFLTYRHMWNSYNC